MQRPRCHTVEEAVRIILDVSDSDSDDPNFAGADGDTASNKDMDCWLL